MKNKFRPLYGRDHKKTQAALKKNREHNPSITPEDAAKWEKMEAERRSKPGGLHDWGPSWQKVDGEQ